MKTFGQILKEWMINQIDPVITIQFGNTNQVVNKVPLSEVSDCLKRIKQSDTKFNIKNYKFLTNNQTLDWEGLKKFNQNLLNSRPK
jgi:hypothetical protein